MVNKKLPPRFRVYVDTLKEARVALLILNYLGFHMRVSKPHTDDEYYVKNYSNNKIFLIENKRIYVSTSIKSKVRADYEYSVFTSIDFQDLLKL